MCLPFILFILNVLMSERVTAYPYKDYVLAYIPIEEFASLSPEQFDVVPLPYYGNLLYPEPWNIERQLIEQFRYYYQPNSRRESFGGPVRARGGVNIVGGFGNQGYGPFTSYAAPPTPMLIAPQPTTRTYRPLPTITSLPPVAALPEITLPCITKGPSIVSVPITPMPITMATKSTSLTNAIDSSYISVTSDVDANVARDAGSVKFGGMVPASGRVKICKTFC